MTYKGGTQSDFVTCALSHRDAVVNAMFAAEESKEIIYIQVSEMEIIPSVATQNVIFERV